MAKVTDVSDLIARWRADGHKLRSDGSAVEWIPADASDDPASERAAAMLKEKLEARKEEIFAYLANERDPRTEGALPDLEDHPATLVDRAALPGGLVRITLEASAAVMATYAHPGQYIQIRYLGHQSYFALAGDIGLGQRWEAVVRPKGTVATALATSEIGSVLSVSTALGVGFPLHDIAGRRLAIAAAGTGMAAGRAIVREMIRRGEGANARVFMGFRTEEDVLFREDFAAWLESGIGIRVCLSRGAANGEVDPKKVIVHAGYVQSALARDLREVSYANIFVVGPRAMVQDIRELAAAGAMDQRDILTNT